MNIKSKIFNFLTPKSINTIKVYRSFTDCYNLKAIKVRKSGKIHIEKVNPEPRYGEFGDNEPGSDFLLIAR